MIQTNPLLGVGMHAVGALSAASCYTPQKKTTQWAWEIYWITQATFAWLILPLISAFLIVPDYLGVLASCQASDMIRTVGIGMIYGVGGLSFGLGVRYIGFSLNYAIAIGISAILGTLRPLFWTFEKGFDIKLGTLVESTSGLCILAGYLLAIAGILLCGYAGAMRERSGGAAATSFNFRRGIPWAVLAGVLSAVFEIALSSGAPLAESAKGIGVAQWLADNAKYPFTHGGAWLTNVIWCIFLIRKKRTAGQLVRLPEGGVGKIGFYYLMSLLSGAFWFFQFFFYGIGHQFLGGDGGRFGFTSWVIHMSLLILFSNIYGKLFREWEGASKWPRRVVHYGMIVIVISTGLITLGNYLADQKKTEPPTPIPNTVNDVVSYHHLINQPGA